jgi:hypothetical protein
VRVMSQSPYAYSPPMYQAAQGGHPPPMYQAAQGGHPPPMYQAAQGGHPPPAYQPPFYGMYMQQPGLPPYYPPPGIPPAYGVPYTPPHNEMRHAAAFNAGVPMPMGVSGMQYNVHQASHPPPPPSYQRGMPPQAQFLFHSQDHVNHEHVRGILDKYGTTVFLYFKLNVQTLLDEHLLQVEHIVGIPRLSRNFQVAESASFPGLWMLARTVLMRNSVPLFFCNTPSWFTDEHLIYANGPYHDKVSVHAFFIDAERYVRALDGLSPSSKIEVLEEDPVSNAQAVGGLNPTHPPVSRQVSSQMKSESALGTHNEHKTTSARKLIAMYLEKADLKINRMVAIYFETSVQPNQQNLFPLDVKLELDSIVGCDFNNHFKFVSVIQNGWFAILYHFTLGESWFLLRDRAHIFSDQPLEYIHHASESIHTVQIQDIYQKVLTRISMKANHNDLASSGSNTQVLPQGAVSGITWYFIPDTVHATGRFKTNHPAFIKLSHEVKGVPQVIKESVAHKLGVSDERELSFEPARGYPAFWKIKKANAVTPV